MLMWIPADMPARRHVLVVRTLLREMHSNVLFHCWNTGLLSRWSALIHQRCFSLARDHMQVNPHATGQTGWTPGKEKDHRMENTTPPLNQFEWMERLPWYYMENGATRTIQVQENALPDPGDLLGTPKVTEEEEQPASRAIPEARKMLTCEYGAKHPPQKSEGGLELEHGLQGWILSNGDTRFGG